MGYKLRKKEGEFDFDNLPPGNYSFSGEEGIVEVFVDQNRAQKWDFTNWFSSLDPDAYKNPTFEEIAAIKQRIDINSGTIKSLKKKKKNKFFRYLFQDK